MAEVEILHRLFSHAAIHSGSPVDWSAVPLEDHDASAALPALVLEALDLAITKMRPAGASTAWMVTRYAADEGSYACVVTSYPDVVVEAKRPGLITHARIVRAPAGQAWLDVAALVQTAEAFPIEAVRSRPLQERLTQYVNFLSAETTIALREVSLTEIDLPRTFLCGALVGCLNELGKRSQMRLALPAPERTLMSELALAWAAIPVALQHGSTWAVGVDNGLPVDVVFSTSEGRTAAATASETMVSFVSRYVNLLLDGPYDFLPVLRNPDVNSLTKLNDAVQKAEPLSFASGLASSSAGKPDMTKPKNNAPQTSASRRELDVETTVELDRQFRAMEASLRMYIDQRLAVLDTQQPLRADGIAGVGKWGWERALAVVGALALLVAVVWGSVTFIWRDGTTPTQPVRVTNTTADATTTVSSETTGSTQTTTPDRSFSATQRAAVRNAIDTAERDNKWAIGLKSLIESDGPVVSAALRGLVRDLPPSSRAGSDMQFIAFEIDAKSLASRDQLRRLVVDALNVRTGDASVDGDLSDVTRDRLDEIKNRYRVTSTSNDVTNIELQSEIILRWMESLP